MFRLHPVATDLCSGMFCARCYRPAAFKLFSAVLPSSSMLAPPSYTPLHTSAITPYVCSQSPRLRLPIRVHHMFATPWLKSLANFFIRSRCKWVWHTCAGGCVSGHIRTVSTSPCSLSDLSPRGSERGRSRLVRGKVKREQLRIKSKVVLVIDENGENLGEMSTELATQLAAARGLEIVLVQRETDSAKAVCKYISKKQLYDEKKKHKEQTKKDPRQVTKEIPISTKISEHDLEFKLDHVREFLEKKFNVCIVVEGNFRKYFSESQIDAEKKLQVEVLKQVARKLEGLGSKVDRSDVQKGRKLTCTFKSLVQ